MDRPRFIPPGWPTVISRIVVDDPEGLVGFVKHVFGADGEYEPDRPAVLRIGESVVMISEADIRRPNAAFLYVYVENADETHRRAIDAGARSVEEPADLPYGDRRAMVEDAWGNVWQVATYRGK
jgi:PhnB protein